MNDCRVMSYGPSHGSVASRTCEGAKDPGRPVNLTGPAYSSCAIQHTFDRNLLLSIINRGGATRPGTLAARPGRARPQAARSAGADSRLQRVPRKVARCRRRRCLIHGKVNSANYGMEPASHQEPSVGGHVLNWRQAGDLWVNSQQLAVAAPAMCPSHGELDVRRGSGIK